MDTSGRTGMHNMRKPHLLPSPQPVPPCSCEQEAVNIAARMNEEMEEQRRPHYIRTVQKHQFALYRSDTEQRIIITLLICDTHK